MNRRTLALLNAGTLALAAACSSVPLRAGAPSWTPAGEILFYAEAPGERADLFIMAADGSRVRQLTKTPAAAEGYPSMSPDGTKIAYESDAAGGNFDIWVMEANGFNMDADGTAIARLTSGSTNWFPQYSPGRTELFAMAADGSNQRRLATSSIGSALDPRWSPDGTRIVFVEATQVRPDAPPPPNAESHVSVLDVATGKITRLR